MVVIFMTLDDKIHRKDGRHSSHMAKRLLKLTRKPQHVYVLFPVALEAEGVKD